MASAAVLACKRSSVDQSKFGVGMHKFLDGEAERHRQRYMSAAALVSRQGSLRRSLSYRYAYDQNEREVLVQRGQHHP